MISSRYVTEIGYLSFNHVGEELCGDHIEVTSKDESTKILVLADGLGSGVKANILSTLTSKMLSSMIAGDISIKECIRCIANTLPVCKVRKVAYSTFTIIKIKDNKYVDIYNFDNPTPFLIHDGKVMELSYSSTVIDNKTIYHAKYEASLYDTFILMSDGYPTSPDWNDHLTLLRKKGWFKVALKYALAIQINDREALDVLTAFTGNPETVLKVYTAEALRKVIKVIAVTASKVKSSSSQVQNNKVLSTNEAAQVEINKGLEEVEDIEW